MEKEKLVLIPKAEKYIEYIIELIIKLPRTEKFSIGNEYKESMYKMLECIMYLNKVKSGSNYRNKYIKQNTNESITGNIEKIDITQDKDLNLIYLNKIDTLLNCQRIYLRIMKKYKWIDEKKFNVAIEKIYEIGKILGGLIKYYGKEY